MRTTDSSHPHAAPPNLIKDLVLTRPNQAWAADITYVRTGTGWVYLAAVIDLYSRKIIGWATSTTLHAKVVVDALNQALATRDWSPGLIHHSDRGVQYACREFRALLEQHGIQQSMSARGNCCDSAVMESFFGTLKAEEDGSYEDPGSARRAIFDYVETYYNRQRIHTSLDGQSPEAFEYLHWTGRTESQKPEASEEFSEDGMLPWWEMAREQVPQTNDLPPNFGVDPKNARPPNFGVDPILRETPKMYRSVQVRSSTR